MKRTPRLKKTLRIAAPFLLVVLLALAILPAAVMAQPPGGNPPGSNPPGSNPPGSNPPTATPTANAPNSQPPGSGGGPNNGPPQATATPVPVATTAPDSSMQPHPSAPFTPPADCIVAHAATPVQLCSIADGLQFYYIGADGNGQPGPWIAPFSQLTASVFSGANPMTGKSVTITYLAADNKIRISTYYPDTMYDTNKPYIFTVDASNNVAYEAW